MSNPRWILLLVLASAALLAVAAAWPEAPGAGPAPHPQHPSMLVAGAPLGPGMTVLGWAFGLVQIAFFGACFGLGVRRRGRLGPIAKPLGVGLGLYAAVWTALVVTAATTDPAAPLWGSFPPATAWMLYGLWPLPVFFAVLYVRYFERWILNEEDLAAFRARLARVEAAPVREE